MQSSIVPDPALLQRLGLGLPDTRAYPDIDIKSCRRATVRTPLVFSTQRNLCVPRPTDDRRIAVRQTSGC